MGVGGWRVCGVDERKNNVHEYDANRKMQGEETEKFWWCYGKGEGRNNTHFMVLG